MNNTFAPISSTRMVSQARIPNAGHAILSRLSAYQPATDAMIDFRRVPPPTVSACADFETAQLRMIERGVQLLLVVDERNMVTGAVMADALSGRGHVKPVVRDAMIPFSGLEVMQMRNVLCSQVGNIVSALERSQWPCALVVEIADDGRGFAVRGMFCAEQIEARLGVCVNSQ